MRLRWYAARSNGEAQGAASNPGKRSFNDDPGVPTVHARGRWVRRSSMAPRGRGLCSVGPCVTRQEGAFKGLLEGGYEREEPCVSLVASEGGLCLTI